MAAPAAAIRVSRLAAARAALARTAAKTRAWAARRAAAARAASARRAAAAKARRARKAAVIRDKTKVAKAKTALAKEKATAKAYRRGTRAPGEGAGAALASNAPIGGAIVASSLIGSAGGIAREVVDEAGDILDSEGVPGGAATELPTGDPWQMELARRATLDSNADRALALKLARLNARTSIRLATIQRGSAREVAALSNPVIGVGIAFAAGVTTLAALHALSELKTDGLTPDWATGLKSGLAASPSFAAPTLPAGIGSSVPSNFQIAPLPGLSEK